MCKNAPFGNVKGKKQFFFFQAGFKPFSLRLLQRKKEHKNGVAVSDHTHCSLYTPSRGGGERGRNKGTEQNKKNFVR